MGLKRAEQASEVDEVVGLLRCEFGFEGCINAIDGLSVNFSRPRIGEDIKGTAQTSRFEEGGEVFPGLLHRFLNYVPGGVPQFSLKSRAV